MGLRVNIIEFAKITFFAECMHRCLIFLFINYER